jgi:TatA/E family protein of Tat protein translocase
MECPWLQGPPSYYDLPREKMEARMIHPILALIDPPIVLGLAAVGLLLFGADKLPKLARSAGQAKKEFLMGQIDAITSDHDRASS